ncbi:expansin EXLX1 family cellulose-binding protein [Herpetosiphon gulosus]|uniref:F5/8 type C domain-containing protein n=1 Tax=Herpetosiphon gulosus TaxID=1973496 RepID=A0ABP9WZV4_9CHLR
MAWNRRILLSFGMIFSLLASSGWLIGKGNAQNIQTITNPWALRSGRATYYDPTVGMGNCSLPMPSDMLLAAMNTSDYGLADYCGAYVTVNGPRGSVTVKIIDRCPGCVVGGIDLSPQAFERIAAFEAGNVPITWQLISAPNVSGNVIYNYKEGSSQWWAGVQVRNHRNAIAKFEYRNPQGVFQNVDRVNYNYFLVPGGMGTGPFTFRVTDVYGNVFTDSNIPLRSEGDVAGNQQFPYVPTPGSTVTPSRIPTVSPTGTATSTHAATPTIINPTTRPDQTIMNASSTEAGSSTQNALDGNLNTRWSSGLPQAAGQWMYVGLPHVTTVSGIKLDTGNSTGDYPAGFIVQTRDDTSDWVTVASGTGAVQITTINFAARQARYIRVELNANSANWWSIHEATVIFGAQPATLTPTIAPPTNTIVPTTATPTLVPTMAPPPFTATPALSIWQAYTSYSVGSLVKHNGISYRCIQAHTSLPGWEPNIVPALWQPI